MTRLMQANTTGELHDHEHYERGSCKSAPACKPKRVFRPRGVEANGLKYYQERNKSGDYLSVDPETLDYYLKHQAKPLFEGRSTAIRGDVTSVHTGAIHIDFLRKKCRRVSKASIPAEWLEVL